MVREVMTEEPPLDPVEALKHIRTVLEAAAEQAYGTPCEATFHEIRNILDKALPSKPRGRPTAQRGSDGEE